MRPIIYNAILPTRLVGAHVELFSFDKVYLDRLRDGDRSTEQHFVAYFEQLLRIKLRARLLPPDIVDELSQETFTRVLAALRGHNSIRHPERFGSFVNSVCNNVLMEFYRSNSRAQPLEPYHLEKTDRVLDVEDSVVSQEEQAEVLRILKGLPRRDRRLLRAIFLEEKDKDEVCVLFHVDRDYLRVLLHRAKDRFRAVYIKNHKLAPPKAIGKLNV